MQLDPRSVVRFKFERITAVSSRGRTMSIGSRTRNECLKVQVHCAQRKVPVDTHISPLEQTKKKKKTRLEIVI